jgi:hypothetical protein
MLDSGAEFISHFIVSHRLYILYIHFTKLNHSLCVYAYFNTCTLIIAFLYIRQFIELRRGVLKESVHKLDLLSTLCLSRKQLLCLFSFKAVRVKGRGTTLREIQTTSHALRLL